MKHNFEDYHHTMVDFCVDMDSDHLSSMLNNHYSEFIKAYPTASKIADGGDDIKFVEENGSLKIKMNKGIDTTGFCGSIEDDCNCTSIRLE